MTSNIKFKILRRIKSLQEKISPLYAKTVLDTALTKVTSDVCYAMFDSQDSSITFHRNEPHIFHLAHPDNTESVLFLAQRHQTKFKTLYSISDTIPIFPIRIDALYLSNLNVKTFHNSLGSLLTRYEKAHFALLISKYLPYKTWIKFLFTWKIYERKTDIFKEVLKVLSDSRVYEKTVSLTTNQKNNIYSLIKDICTGLWTPEIAIFQQHFLDKATSFSGWLDMFCQAIFSYEEGSTMQIQLSKLFSQLWKLDQRYSDYIYFIMHFTSPDFEKVSLKINKLTAMNLVEAPFNNLLSLPLSNFSIEQSPFFLGYKTVDDCVSYYNVSVQTLVPYCSNSVLYQYQHSLNHCHIIFNKYIEKLLKYKYKHNVNLYTNISGQSTIEILYLYKEDLHLFLDFLIKNPHYLFFAFETSKFHNMKISEIHQHFLSVHNPSEMDSFPENEKNINNETSLELLNKNSHTLTN